MERGERGKRGSLHLLNTDSQWHGVKDPLRVKMINLIYPKKS